MTYENQNFSEDIGEFVFKRSLKIIWTGQKLNENIFCKYKITLNGKTSCRESVPPLLAIEIQRKGDGIFLCTWYTCPNFKGHGDVTNQCSSSEDITWK